MKRRETKGRKEESKERRGGGGGMRRGGWRRKRRRRKMRAGWCDEIKHDKLTTCLPISRWQSNREKMANFEEYRMFMMIDIDPWRHCMTFQCLAFHRCFIYFHTSHKFHSFATILYIRSFTILTQFQLNLPRMDDHIGRHFYFMRPTTNIRSLLTCSCSNARFPASLCVNKPLTSMVVIDNY